MMHVIETIFVFTGMGVITLLAISLGYGCLEDPTDEGDE